MNELAISDMGGLVFLLAVIVVVGLVVYKYGGNYLIPPSPAPFVPSHSFVSYETKRFFKLAATPALNDIEAQVNQFLVEGWEPQGGVHYDGHKYLVAMMRTKCIQKMEDSKDDN